ncbi:hypothetical protein ES703_63154 [subsurface metagenome]
MKVTSKTSLSLFLKALMWSPSSRRLVLKREPGGCQFTGG